MVEVWLPDAEKWNAAFSASAMAALREDQSRRPRRSERRWIRRGDEPTWAPRRIPIPAVGNPEVWKDFGFRATHLMTVAAKQIVRAHYGKEPEFSYFSGGSTGGQQALQEAQRLSRGLRRHRCRRRRASAARRCTLTSCGTTRS